jgi:hypothetical protein
MRLVMPSAWLSALTSLAFLKTSFWVVFALAWAGGKSGKRKEDEAEGSQEVEGSMRSR